MEREIELSNSQLESNSLESSPICTSTVDQKKRKPNLHITAEQKELMINYIIDNPEIITHSSTKENERELWKELQIKLNNLKPEKSIDCWKNFWQRWRTNITSKPETVLTQLDCRLKIFLTKIMNNSENVDEGISKIRYTVKEVEDTIREIEKEKRKLQLEVDEGDYKIEIYKNVIKRLETQNTEKRKRIHEVNKKKRYLNRRRKILTKREENTYESSELKTMKKKLKEEPIAEN